MPLTLRHGLLALTGVSLLGVLALLPMGMVATLSGLASMLLGTALGWSVHQVWRNPKLLRQAEQHWRRNATPEAVEALLHRMILPSRSIRRAAAHLRSEMALRNGNRDQAWHWALEADLLALSPKDHRAVGPWFQEALTAPSATLAEQGVRFAALHPEWARLRQMQGLLLLRDADPTRRALGWDALLKALALATDDLLLLEDLMLLGLSRLEARQQSPLQLGAQNLEPELPHLFEAALTQLRGRFGLAHFPWDRIAPARYWLEHRCPEAVLTLAETVAPEVREPLLWEYQIQALLDLGAHATARRALEQALGRHPRDFHLLMLAHQSALDRRRDGEARAFLEAARAVIDPEDTAQTWDWMVRRAEFAFWVDQNAAEAWHWLQQVPAAHRGAQHPPLELELMVALGRAEEAYPAIQEQLNQQPKDVELALLQGDCLAAMGAWEALEAYLESQEEPIRGQADYWHHRGVALSALGRKAEARESFERAAFMAQHQLAHVLEAGHACMDLGDWERAAHHWRQALTLDPTHEEALIELSETRRLAHDPEGAKRYLRECLLHHPESDRAQHYLAEIEAN